MSETGVFHVSSVQITSASCARTFMPLMLVIIVQGSCQVKHWQRQFLVQFSASLKAIFRSQPRSVAGHIVHFTVLRDYGIDASTLLDEIMSNTTLKLRLKPCAFSQSFTDDTCLVSFPRVPCIQKKMVLLGFCLLLGCLRMSLRVFVLD